MIDLNKLYDKLDKISIDISEIRILDAIQNEQLKEHMRRSDLLEKRIEQVDKRWLTIAKAIASVIGVLAALKGMSWL